MSDLIEDARRACDALEAMEQAATPGPWTYRENAIGGCGPNYNERRVYAVEIIGDCRCHDFTPWKPGLKRWSSRVVACIQDWAKWTDHPANRDLICATRNTLRAQIGCVRALCDACGSLKEGPVALIEFVLACCEAGIIE